MLSEAYLGGDIMSPGKPKGRKNNNSPDGLQQLDITGASPADNNFPVVALGASAGGLEAFTQFLTALTHESGIAYVLVQHLDPSHPSSLVELLNRVSPIPIVEATEGMPVKPNHAYIIPPGKSLSIHNRTLSVVGDQEHPGITHSINHFFHSLAEDVKERAVGIILSGTGSDGSDGARTIKANDGLVIVQDPVTAKYDGMPKSAIEAGVADYILPPAAMASQLKDYLDQSFYKRERIRQALKKDDVNMKSIFSLVKMRTGRDFSGYKISTITRRIEHQMAVNSIETLGNYLKFLRENPNEIEALMKNFLIQVTSFFRDKEAFESLKQKIGLMLKDKPEGTQLRAWVPGCSTGEEAYSIAIIIMECIQESGRRFDVQVFGTDLDAEAIAIARAGLYPTAIAKDVDPKRLDAFFNQAGSSYQIKKNIRENVIFAVHDVVTDPPYSRVDVISMRNLLIYFDSELQKKVLPMLHYALNEKGILFLGTSETIGEFTDLFANLDAKWRIYQSLGKKKTSFVNFSNQLGLQDVSVVTLSKAKTQSSPKSEPFKLLEALPPSVLVDYNHQVLYAHGDTSKYLRISEGKPSSSLVNMVKPELESGLATLLHEASQGQKEVVSDNLQVEYNGGKQHVKITVRPLSTLEGDLIITFEDLPRPKRHKIKGEPVIEAKQMELEKDLQRTRDTLRGTIEELKSTNEELRSANEEYMSTNEELKSANEELETSREELQSVNEELTTLNSESQRKNEDLTTINNDMLNLLNATGVATVFLDEKLRIRRFTPSATKLFKFIDSDIGRPVEDISSPLKDNILVQASRSVLDNLIPVEQEVQTTDGKWYSLRILPYRTLENVIEGVVVSFVDITQVKVGSIYTESIIDTMREPMLVLDEHLKVVSANKGFYRAFKVTMEDTQGQLIYAIGNHQWDIPQLRELLKSIIEKNSVFDGYKVEHDFPGIGQREMLLNARRVVGGTDLKPRILLAMEDVTGRPGLEQFTEKENSQKGDGR
jgi:two-component system CheB/CheR fusion protein